MDIITYTLAKKYTDRKTGLSKRLPVSTPEGFIWQGHPLVGKIFTDGRGRFEVDFDVSTLKHTGANKTYFVDVNNGNDSNDGLSLATALKTIGAALSKSDVDIIMLASGLYHRTEGFNGASLSKNISLIAVPGAKVQITTHTPISSWELSSGKTNTYQANRSLVYAVFDSSVVDHNGDYLSLTKMSSVDDVESTPGSWFTDGAVVYVHTPDGRPPDHDIRAYLGVYNANVTTGLTFYAEGIDFEGGSAGCIRGGPSSKIYAKNCSFKYANGNGGIHIVGSEIVLFQDCEAAMNIQDGFNYHAGSGVYPRFIEIGCVGRDNGVDNNDNGSSSHEGNPGIRINGVYCRNYGPNIADVDTDTRTWNLGCAAFESRGTDAQRADFQIAEGAEGWYDSCVGYGSNYSLSVGSGSVANIRNVDFQTESVSGTKQPY